MGISEKEVVDLAEQGKIPAYKVGGVYLRFKREQIETLKNSLKPLTDKIKASAKAEWPSGDFTPEKNSLGDRISDFFYFNDFYILTVLAILLLLILIFRVY